MAKFFDALTPEHTEFIARQKVFFIATAPDQGRINLSPKGLDSLRVLGPNTVAYLDLTGSSAETAAHLRKRARMTMMFCSFDQDALILRLYGRGEGVTPSDPRWAGLAALFPDYPGPRQVVVLHVESLQTSCGAGLPLMDYRGDRETLLQWARNKGPEGIAAYRRSKNAVSIDGLPTGLELE